MSTYRVFDSHCDTATELWRRGENFDKTSCHVNLSGMEEFEGYAQFFAFCTYGGLNLGWSCEELLWLPYAYFTERLREHADAIALCRTGSELDAVLQCGKAAAMLSLEGAEGIKCDPGRLEELRNAGFSMINLTWNADNALAGSAVQDGPGLSALGKEFVKRAQSLGIMIDVSHVSDRAFWDIMDITVAPVVASHSNSRSICAHPRNLTDDQFRAICQCGGYAGINLYSEFLNTGRQASLEDVVAHIDHFLHIGGGRHVALGGDLDGCDKLPKQFNGIWDYEKLAAFLESKHYSGELINRIFSKTIEEVVKICTT